MVREFGREQLDERDRRIYFAHRTTMQPDNGTAVLFKFGQPPEPLKETGSVFPIKNSVEYKPRQEHDKPDRK